MIVGFTGTREGMTESQKKAFTLHIQRMKVDQFHHGMCVGADQEAEVIVRILHSSAPIHGHPPKNKSNISRASRPDVVHKAAEYLVRNRHIVDACEIIFATPKTEYEILQSGTWSAVRYARKKNKMVRIIPP
jgi:hypothetical protein